MYMTTVDLKLSANAHVTLDIKDVSSFGTAFKDKALICMARAYRNIKNMFS